MITVLICLKYKEAVLGISLTNTITNEDMARMNYEVETNGREPKDVAHEYLVSKGLV